MNSVPQHSVFSEGDSTSSSTVQDLGDLQLDQIASETPEQQFVSLIRAHHPNVDEKYRFQFHLGCGSFGHVLSATDSNGNWRAIKIIEETSLIDATKESWGSNESKNAKNKTGSKVWRLIQEIACMQRCNGCPAIVQLCDFFEDVSAIDQSLRIFMVMEFCDGDLEEWSQFYPNLTEKQTSCIFFQVLEACAFMQQNKVIHRDIKPENILITKMEDEHPTTKLCDFGMSEILDFVHLDVFRERLPRLMTLYSHLLPKQRLSHDEKVRGAFGSPLYMPPEMFRQISYSYPADVWSIGMLFYVLMYGRSPYKCKTYAELQAFVTGDKFCITFPNEVPSPVRSTKMKYRVEGLHNSWKFSWNCILRKIFVAEYLRCTVDDLLEFYLTNGCIVQPDSVESSLETSECTTNEDNTDALGSFIILDDDTDASVPLVKHLEPEACKQDVSIKGLLSYVVDENYRHSCK